MLCCSPWSLWLNSHCCLSYQAWLRSALVHFLNFCFSFFVDVWSQVKMYLLPQSYNSCPACFALKYFSVVLKICSSPYSLLGLCISASCSMILTLNALDMVSLVMYGLLQILQLSFHHVSLLFLILQSHHWVYTFQLLVENASFHFWPCFLQVLTWSVCELGYHYCCCLLIATLAMSTYYLHGFMVFAKPAFSTSHPAALLCSVFKFCTS